MPKVGHPLMIGVKDFNMGFVPEDAEWYLAEIVQELTVEDDPRNMIWRNLTLMKADSPDHAYERALEMGQAGNNQYLNPDGKLVITRFQGLSFMDVVHDPLEDRAELMFSSQTGVNPEELRSLLRPKKSSLSSNRERGSMAQT